MLYKEIEIKSDSIPITLSIWEASPDSPTIIFLPGTMSHPLMYRQFLEGLCNYGFHVIGVHYLSHGKSPKLRETYTMGDLAQNVSDAATFAIEHYGENIALMGSSQGGILAAMVAGIDHRFKALFPHNIMLTTLQETMSLTKFPVWTHRFMGLILAGFRVGAFLFPKIKIKGDAYLDYDRVFHSEQAKEDCLNDPLLLPHYPFQFISSLFNADMSCLGDGSLSCPVMLITARGDPLFSLSYTLKVFDLIKAPKKELLVLEADRHMLFNEDVEKTLAAIQQKLHDYLS